MSQNVTPGLSGKKARAAVLVAADDLTDEQIAAELSIARRTLVRWRSEGDFAGAVESARAELRSAAVEQGIADRKSRVAALNDRWLKLQRVIHARAKEHGDVPGGDTGLLVRQVKLIKVYAQDGEDDEDVEEELEGQPHGGALKRRRRLASVKLSEEVAEYSIDTGLLKELREHERQAAQELGQWSEKVDLNATMNYGRLSDDELEARIAELEGRARSISRPDRGTGA